MTEIAERSLIDRLREFLETEARSGSMDFGCVTPLYIYRMWGGQVPLNEIEEAFVVHGSRFMVNDYDYRKEYT